MTPPLPPPRLCRSVAILTYLAQKLPSPVSDRWYPAELRLRARLNEYLSWQHANLRSHGSRVFMLRVGPRGASGVRWDPEL